MPDASEQQPAQGPEQASACGPKLAGERPERY
jgi:hypothetical protein